MMGTKEALPEAPAQKTVFIEDLTDEQLASAVSRPRFIFEDVAGSIQIQCTLVSL